jgi:hypothetical protein
MVIATDTVSANFVTLPSVSVLRTTPHDELVPGTHRLEPDPEEGLTPRYIAQSLALQEASQGVFRHLPDDERIRAELIYDTEPSTPDGRMSRLRDLHSFRDLNTRQAADKVN